MLSLIRSANTGWQDAITLLLLGVGVIAGGALVVVERRQDDPLLDFKDFSKLLFSAGAALGFLSGMLSAVALFFDPLYLQIIKGQSPQLSGLVLFVIPVTVVLVSLMVGWLIHRLGTMNTILIAILLGILATLLHAMFTADSALVLVIVAFVCLGAVWAMYTVSIIATQTVVGPARASVATGTIVTMFNIGGSIGLAVAVVIYHIFAMRALHGALESEYVGQLIDNPASFLQTQTTELVHTLFSNSFMHGFSGIMWFLSIVVSTIFLCVLLGKIVVKSEKAYVSE